jgi:hypothetical protein
VTIGSCVSGILVPKVIKGFHSVAVIVASLLVSFLIVAPEEKSPSSSKRTYTAHKSAGNPDTLSVNVGVVFTDWNFHTLGTRTKVAGGLLHDQLLIDPPL